MVCRTTDSANIHTLLLWMIILVSVTAAQAAQSSCLSSSGEAAVEACRDELKLAPHDLDVRFALSDALIGLRRHEEAVEVLKEGLARSPGSERIKKKLSLAESYLSEQSWIEKRRAQQAGAAGESVSKKLDTQTKLNIIRCTKLQGANALKACNSVLAVLPDDPALHRKKADVLMKMDRIVDAVLAYREALRLAPDDAGIAKKLSVAQSKRKALVGECQRLTGTAALRACDAGLLKGAEDEFAIQQRRGDLFLEMKRMSEAERAYRSALELSPDDAQTQSKLDSLREPVTIAKVDGTKGPRKKIKPQVPATVQQPVPATAPPLPQTRVQETSALAPTAEIALSEQAGETSSSAATLSSSPVLSSPRRYSNRPPIAGITH